MLLFMLLLTPEVSAPRAAIRFPILTPNLNSKHYYSVPHHTRKVSGDIQ